MPAEVGSVATALVVAVAVVEGSLKLVLSPAAELLGAPSAFRGRFLGLVGDGANIDSSAAAVPVEKKKKKGEEVEEENTKMCIK